MRPMGEIFQASLREHPVQREWLRSHSFLIGDIHNHSAISYGHGSLETAIDFAKQQLDFFSVTGHFAWPDMGMEGRKVPPQVIAYHKEGFSKLRNGWADYLVRMAASEDTLVPFISYEYHSFLLGDYTIVCKDLRILLPEEPADGEDLRLIELLKTNDAQKSGILCIPHHIGYKTGYRGINWDTFNEQASPLVEIISMHGCAESDDAPFPYLHTMGPRHHGNTMQGGLARGFRFGVIGSTDHHNASPGSFGSGRCGVWATERTRDAIWSGLIGKSTLALSGDPVEMACFVNDVPIGGTVVPTKGHMRIDAYVQAPSRLDRVELVGDNRVLQQFRPTPDQAVSSTGSSIHRVDFSCGWGQRGIECTWNLDIRVKGGRLIDAMPRLRGEYVVDPLSKPREVENARPRFSFSDGIASLHCVTSGNVTSTTDDTQGISLEWEGGDDYLLEIDVDAEFSGTCVQKTYVYNQEDLMKGPLSEYIDGFVSPSFRLSSEIALSECTLEIHEDIPCDLHYVYLRAFERNGDAAWATPIWIEH